MGTSIWPDELAATNQTAATLPNRVLVVAGRAGQSPATVGGHQVMHVHDPGTEPDRDKALLDALKGFREVVGHTMPHRLGSGAPTMTGIVGGMPVRAIFLTGAAGVLGVYDELSDPEVTFYCTVRESGRPAQSGINFAIPDYVPTQPDGSDEPRGRAHHWDITDRDRWLAWVGFTPAG